MNLDQHHAAIWAAIDAIAKRQGISVSRLAILSGQDSTMFNKSKRFSPDGTMRWLSTLTIAKVLAVSGVGWAEFGEMVSDFPERSYLTTRTGTSA